MKKITFLLLLAFPSMAQIGAKVQQGKLYGVWQNSQFGYQMTMILQPDGTGEFDGEAIRFTAQGSILTIIIGAIQTKYTYSLSENSLKLSGGDLDGQVVFSRSGTGNVGSTSTTSSNTTSNDAAFSNTDKKLIGLWSGSGEMIEFRSDGNCVYLGNTYPYKISQGHVILSPPQGNVSFQYSIRDTQLTLSANGQSIIYNRVATTTKPGVAVFSGGNVPMELVGQWCYMNMNQNSQTSRCINLNADGTYTYNYEGSRSVNTETLSGGTSSQNSDRGTWYVQGDRIYYNSQSSGQGSYRLEKRNHPKNVNDPMIVLDGEPYVTSTARAPWR